MFGRKKIRCLKCGKDSEKKFDFCPYCANPLKNLKKDYGLLGKTDNINEMDEVFKHSFASSGLGGSLFDKMFSSAFKMLNAEIKKIAEEEGKMQKNSRIRTPQNPNLHSNFELFINGKRVNLPGNIAGIQIEGMPGAPSQNSAKNNQEKKSLPKVSEEVLKNSAKLPRKEAKSKISRTSNTIVYELETPGLNSINNVLINRLENSIEIKAFAEDAVYFKSLPGKLPLLRYSLNSSEGKLFLEFRA